MKVSLRTTTLVLFAMLFCQAYSQSLIENRQSYCKDQNLDPNLLSKSQLKSERDHTYTDFYSNYKELFDYYKDPSSNKFVKMFNYQFGLYLTLTLLIVISFIIFCFVCCMYCKCWGRKRCWYECLVLFVIFFICFVGLFIAVLVFIGISQNHSGPAYCTVFSVPAAVIYGNPGVYHKQEFIGYQNFTQFLGNYTSDVANIGIIAPDAQAISNANLPGISKDSINSVLAFKQGFINRKVNNGNGVVSVPDSIAQNPDSVSLEIESDFGAYDVLSQKLDGVATEVGLLQNSAYRASSIKDLNALKTNLTTPATELEYLGRNFTEKSFKIQNYAIAGFWTFFAISLVIIALSIVAIILLCLMKDGKRQHCLNCVRALLIFITFFVIIYAICVLILMAGISGMSSFCKFTGDLNQGNWNAANMLTTYLGDSTGQLIKGCFLANGTGYIPDLVDSSPSADASFNRLLGLVDGLKGYSDFIANNDLSKTTSPSIANQVNTWTAISGGKPYDSQYANPSLQSFNSGNNCANKNFDFTTTSCTASGKSNCVAILGNTYSADACVGSSSGSLTTSFNNLSQYISGEQTLMSDMTAGINGAPATSYAKLINAIKGVKGNADNLKIVFKNTLGTVSGFKNSMSEITQCQNLKVELLQFERYTCFPFTKPLYVLLILAFVSTLFLLFMVWAFYIALMHKEDGNVENRPVIVKPEHLSVVESETVPRY